MLHSHIARAVLASLAIVAAGMLLDPMEQHAYHPEPRMGRTLERKQDLALTHTFLPNVPLMEILVVTKERSRPIMCASIAVVVNPAAPG